MLARLTAGGAEKPTDDTSDPFDVKGDKGGTDERPSGHRYGLFGKPGEFVPQARALGAGLIRAYLYLGQVEPEPGRDDWTVPGALLGPLDGDAKAWITLRSSSPWGTRVTTDFQPQSPARDERANAGFVRRVVGRCAGRVRYWQCNNEPATPACWGRGIAAEYVTQLSWPRPPRPLDRVLEPRT